uniref:Haem-binding uptake Tiki superfamily ChaN domain-containing protein n=1 Tax=Chaetoceros debilis TaxID=122233 RepID=A0A7S3Q1E0_9STRA
MKTTATCLLALLSAPSAISFQPNAAGISCGYKVSASKLISTGTEQCGESNMSLQVFSNNEVVEGASNVEMSSRRQWIPKSATAAASSIDVALANPFASFAETETESLAATQIANIICDPSVSTFCNPSNNHVVHLLGTAHISSTSSVDVAGQMVRDTKPSAVFVELDAKRVGRAIPKPSANSEPVSNAAGEATASPVTATPVPAPAPIPSTAVNANVVEAKGAQSSNPPPKSNPLFGIYPINFFNLLFVTENLSNFGIFSRSLGTIPNLLSFNEIAHAVSFTF